MLYSINWPNFIIWSSLLLEVSGKMCIFICCPFCDVMNLKLALVFWPSHFPTRPKAKQAFKCLKNVKRFLDEMKRIFHHFWRALIKVSKTIVIRNGNFPFLMTMVKPTFMEGENPTLIVPKQKIFQYLPYLRKNIKHFSCYLESSYEIKFQYTLPTAVVFILLVYM